MKNQIATLTGANNSSSSSGHNTHTIGSSSHTMGSIVPVKGQILNTISCIKVSQTRAKSTLPPKLLDETNQMERKQIKDIKDRELDELNEKFGSKLCLEPIDLLFQQAGSGMGKKADGAKYLIKDKADRATVEQVLDPRTRMILFKLINR